MEADWTRRAAYIRFRHGIHPHWANEALADDRAVRLRPDPASKSGLSVRVIGYSVSAGDLLTVILVDPAAEPGEEPDGDWWGANAWWANARDRALYAEGGSNEQP